MLITMNCVISFWNLIAGQEKWDFAKMLVTKHSAFFNWANLQNVCVYWKREQTHDLNCNELTVQNLSAHVYLTLHILLRIEQNVSSIFNVDM